MPDAGADVEALLRSRGLHEHATAVTATSPHTGPVSWAWGRSPTGAPVTAETPMYAASIAKQVVAVLAGRMVVAGQLDPEGSISQLLVEPPAWMAPIRVRHLVHHTSGMPATRRVIEAIGVDAEEQLDNRLVLEGLRRLPGPDRAPGQVFAYSNIGYVCLAEVVRRVGPGEVGELAAELFSNLGMSGSHLGRGDDLGAPDRRPPPRTIGDGGLWTTASDMVRWLQALDDQRLGRALTDLVQTPGHLDDGTPLAYAWGMTAREDARGVIFSHGGNWPGWTAKTVRQPATRTAVAVLTGSDDVEGVSAVATAVLHRLALRDVEGAGSSSQLSADGEPA